MICKPGVGCLALGKRGDAHRVRARLGLMKHSPAARAALTQGARNRYTAKHSMEQARAVRELATMDVPPVLISWATGVSLDSVLDSVFQWRPAGA